MVSVKQSSFTVLLALGCLIVIYGLMQQRRPYRVSKSKVVYAGKENPPIDVETISDENKKDNSRSKLVLRKPDKELLRKLSKKEKEIERVTEPEKLSPKCSSKVFLAILVISAPGHFEHRTAIRGSWGSTYHLHSHSLKLTESFRPDKFKVKDIVKTVFLVARDSNADTRKLVQAEAETFGDIVLGSFAEAYRNLTMKTRLGLKWAYYYCRVKFLLKTDDDVFVNPVPLVNWLLQQPQQKLYTGWCNFGSVVVRDKGSKWYISKEEFSGDQYPGYCLGGGYLMSGDVLERVMKKSYGRTLFPMEDLYVGLMISEFGDIEPRDERKHFDLIFAGRQSCETTSLFLAHQVKPKDQLYWLIRYEDEQKNCPSV